MRNRDLWQPTRVVKIRGQFRPSSDRRMVDVSSRFIVALLCRFYDQAICRYARGKLLDLGCGHVPYYQMYAPLVSDSVCIDWPQSAHSSPHLDALADLNHSIPLPDNSFDTILLTDVLEHIAEPQILLREIARVMKPGGCLIAGVPFLYWLHETPNDYYRYTEFALRRLCERSGLTVVSLRA